MPHDTKGLCKPPLLHCSFCGKSQDEVRKLITGPNAAHICDECALLCIQIIYERGALNIRAANFRFQLVARILYPVTLMSNWWKKSS